MITVRDNIGEHILNGAVADYTWIDVREVTRDDILTLEEAYGVDTEFLADIMDEDEQSRVEKEDDCLSLILRLPTNDDGDDEDDDVQQYSIPVGVILYENRIITVCKDDSVVLEDLSRNRFRQYPVGTKEGFVLSLLGRSALVYIRILKLLNRKKKNVESHLNRSVRNYELIQLLNIQNSLVYLTTGLAGNESLLEKLQKYPYFRLNTEEERDFLDDTITDTKQAITMANIYADILTGTMDAFASVIANNMNIIMKRLNVISISFLFPTFIASFFGMNIDLPFVHLPNIWLWMLGLCIASALFGIWFVSDRRSRKLIQNAAMGRQPGKIGKSRRLSRKKK